MNDIKLLVAIFTAVCMGIKFFDPVLAGYAAWTCLLAAIYAGFRAAQSTHAAHALHASERARMEALFKDHNEPGQDIPSPLFSAALLSVRGVWHARVQGNTLTSLSYILLLAAWGLS